MSTSWRQSTHANAISQAPQAMAEPMHRIPPPGVTSMASIRDVPKSCIQKVKDICLFYVEKCSGEYVNNKTAARYVHHMAEEIITQLSGVADEIKRNRTDPEMFQALINEWNAYFPKSLDNLGSPKQVAQLLKQQEAEILQLQDELKQVKGRRSHDVEELLKSMDNQLHSYKHSVLLERNHMKQQIDRVIENYTVQLVETKKFYEEEKAVLTSQYEKMLADLAESTSQEKALVVDKYKGELETLYKQIDKKDASHSRKVDLLREKSEVYKEKFMKLCHKYKILVNSIITNKKELQQINNEIDEEMQVISDDTDESFDYDDGSLEVGLESNEGSVRRRSSLKRDPSLSSPRAASADAPGGPGLVPGSRRRSSLIKDNLSTYSDDKKDTLRLEEANLFANAQIKTLQQQVEAAERKHLVYEEKIKLLQNEIVELNSERSAHLKRLDQQEEMIRALQRALALKLTKEKQQHIASVSLESKSDDEHIILCHTPHFLDRPDTYGMEHGDQQLTGYYSSGRF